MTPVLYDYQCIRPADAIQTPSEETQNEKEEREMCNIEQKQKADNGRDDGIIESLLDTGIHRIERFLLLFIRTVDVILHQVILSHQRLGETKAQHQADQRFQFHGYAGLEIHAIFSVRVKKRSGRKRTPSPSTECKRMIPFPGDLPRRPDRLTKIAKFLFVSSNAAPRWIQSGKRKARATRQTSARSSHSVSIPVIPSPTLRVLGRRAFPVHRDHHPNVPVANDNARKVTEKIERLLVALYSMPNKPFCSSVKDLYDMFLTGKITVFDKETGEVFQPEDFRRNGEPVELSESTIWNYLNQAVNRAVADKRRNDGLYYNNLHRPHHHRKSPQYSFSKISMDDRDLPRLLVGGGRVKAYYAYDVASGCVIGAAYSLKKDDKLFLDCLRDMFRLIDRNGFGIPMEVEVEHHLVNHFADTLMRAGVVFPFVRWCAAGNSQEKRAEHLNRAKKYGAEKQMQEQPIGRWYARHEAYRTPSKKVNDEYVERQYDYEVLVAEDLAAIREFNNSVHPRKKTYGGMTRWEVLKSHLNPELQPLGKASLYRYIGERTECSIARSQYVRVQYEKYQLSSPEVMRLLRPNDYNVTAYYMKEEDGDIPRVYLYQGDTFLCACEKIVAYNEARCEQTEADRAAMQEQAKYVARYDRLIKDRMPDRVGLLLPETLHADPDERELQVDIPEAEAKQARGMELVPDYSEEAMRQMALADI